MFFGKEDAPHKKGREATDNGGQSCKQTDDYLEILKNIYDFIKGAGDRGIEYREIINLLNLKKSQISKFENYLLSHYCRKLANIGLVEIQSKMVSKKLNIRFAIDNKYSVDSHKKESDAELLGINFSNKGKRTMKLEETEEGLEDDSGGLDNELERHGTYIERSNYYPSLTCFENLKLNLKSFQAHMNNGICTSELK